MTAARKGTETGLQSGKLLFRERYFSTIKWFVTENAPWTPRARR